MDTTGNTIPPTTVPPREAGKQPTVATGKFKSVLLVDDSKFLADVLTTFFQLDGYTARAAYDGAEALALIEQEVPDIAFVDVDMPGMGGLEFARRVRASSHPKATVLVALSGWDEPEHIRNAEDAGFDHFISKPVDAPAIREFMRKLSEG